MVHKNLSSRHLSQLKRTIPQFEVSYIQELECPQTSKKESDGTLFNRNVTVSEMHPILEENATIFNLSSPSLASSKWKSS